MTNATFKLLTCLSRLERGVTWEEMYSWGFFENKDDFETTLSELENRKYLGKLNPEDTIFHLFGPGEEAIRAERHLRHEYFIMWGTFITSVASLLTAVVALLLTV